MVSRMTDRVERFLPQSEMDMPEHCSLRTAKDTPTKQHDSVANSCAKKKVHGGELKDTCSCSTEGDAALDLT
jgi:hypothetical protein